MKAILVMAIAASLAGCAAKTGERVPLKTPHREFRMVTVANGETNVVALTPKQSAMVEKWVKN